MTKGTLRLQRDPARRHREGEHPVLRQGQDHQHRPARSTPKQRPGIQIEGVDKTGQTQQSVTFFGDFPKCDEKSAPNPMGVGSSFETCLTFLVPGGITKVAYTGTESYIDKPVTWSP